MRKEWRPVQLVTYTEEAMSQTSPQLIGPVDELIVVIRRAAANHTPNTTPYESPKQTNQYQALTMDPLLVQEHDVSEMGRTSNG